MATVENLIWSRIAPNLVVHLSADENALIMEGTTLSMLRYLGLEPVDCREGIHQGLAGLAASEFTMPIGVVRQVGVEASRFDDTTDGCFALLKAVGDAHMRTPLLIVPADRIDARFIDLVRAGRARARLAVLH